MGFAMGSSNLLQSYFPSYSLYSSFSSRSLLFHSKHNHNAETKKKKRVSIVACMPREEPDDIVFSKKRAVLFVGISVLPFLQLRARAIESSFLKENQLKKPDDIQKEELAIQKYTPPNPFLSLLNGLGIFGTGVLGAFYALSRNEKKAAETTIETITGKLKEKEAAIVSLEKNFESTLLKEQEERQKEIKKSKEEQQALLNQLNYANGTIAGLGQELKNEKKIIDDLNVRIDGLESSISKAEEDKKALQQELSEKLSSIEILQNKVNSLSLEIKDKENNVQNLTNSLSEKELELKKLKSSFEGTKDELAKAHTEFNALQDELLKIRKELELKNSVVDELNSTVSSLTFERDESNRKLNAVQNEYDDLELSSEKKAASDAMLLAEREDELHQLKKKLELTLNEVNTNQAMITNLTQEQEGLRKMLDTELNNVVNLKHELQSTSEALGKSKNEVSDMKRELQHSRSRCTELEAEVSRVQSEFAEAKETMEKSLVKAKQSGDMLASELAAVKQALLNSEEELQRVSRELVDLTESRFSVQKELVDVYQKAEVTANELKEEKKVVSSLNKELQNLEKQIGKDREARKSLETDLEEATKSLDEMNRNALMLSGELEIANSKISSLEDDKQVLYKTLTVEKNAAKEARENLEDAHNMVMNLGKERDSLEKKGKKLEGELASAKGEILRLRSEINSSKKVANEQDSQKGEAENKVTVTARRNGRRRRTEPQ